MRILLVYLLAILSLEINATELNVCSSCEFQNLHDAVANSQPFDIIKIQKGVYRTVDLEITHPLTIEGATGAVLDGNNENPPAL